MRPGVWFAIALPFVVALALASGDAELSVLEASDGVAIGGSDLREVASTSLGESAIVKTAEAKGAKATAKAKVKKAAAKSQKAAANFKKAKVKAKKAAAKAKKDAAKTKKGGSGKNIKAMKARVKRDLAWKQKVEKGMDSKPVVKEAEEKLIEAVQVLHDLEHGKPKGATRRRRLTFSKPSATRRRRLNFGKPKRNKAKRPKSIPCFDSKANSKPYVKTVYEKKGMKFQFKTRCEFYKKHKPCAGKYMITMCHKTCTGRGSDRGGKLFPKPYIKKTPVLASSIKYKTTCDYYKAMKRCESKWMKRACTKTCGACRKGSKGCKDKLKPKPYIRKVFKRKSYSSKCAYYRARGLCHKVKRACSKTCTGKGSDVFKRKVSMVVYNRKQYASHCAFLKTRKPCHSTLVRTNCQKTCSGQGTDSIKYRKPYVTVLAKVKSQKKYKSRCAYVKAMNWCSDPRRSDGCSKTCGTCGICSDRSKFCHKMKKRGLCKSARHVKKAANQCKKSCGLCGMCVNKSSGALCKAAAKKGLCKSSKKVAYKCQKSCGLCK